MTIADLLLPEFDQEMATTRRVLERVPEDKFSWKPHDQSSSMGDLASHVVEHDQVDRRHDEADGVRSRERDAGTDESGGEEPRRAARVVRRELPAPRAASRSPTPTIVVPWTLKKGDAGVLHDAALQLRAQLRPEPHRPPSRAAQRVSAVEQHSVPGEYGPSADDEVRI